jgi:hypothetical protein
MKPGDLIEWYYKVSDETVDINEKLWSSIMKKWIPIGIVSMFLHYDHNEETYSWLNSKGYFCAYIDDKCDDVRPRGGRGLRWVSPRVAR